MSQKASRERRTEERKQQILFCQIDCNGKHYPAVVLDVSHSGLFVRTATLPPVGSDVGVTIRLGGGKIWSLRAHIAREAQAGSGRGAVSARGLGLRLIDPPDGFAEFVETLRSYGFRHGRNNAERAE